MIRFISLLALFTDVRVVYKRNSSDAAGEGATPDVLGNGGTVGTATLLLVLVPVRVRYVLEQ